MNWRDEIVVDPAVRFGKPCLRGTRISVSDVLEWLASGMTEEQITKEYPYVRRDGIRAALKFAAERENHLVSWPA